MKAFDPSLAETIVHHDEAYYGLDGRSSTERVSILLAATIGGAVKTLFGRRPNSSDIAQPTQYYKGMLVAGVRCSNLREPLLLGSVIRGVGVADEYPYAQNLWGSATPAGAIDRLLHLQDAYTRGMKPYPSDIATITSSCIEVFVGAAVAGCFDERDFTMLQAGVVEDYMTQMTNLG